MMSAMEELALRMVVHLARHPNQAISTADIADAIFASETTIDEIGSHLEQAGIVRMPHGPTGGYTLFRRPESLTFHDVICAIGPAHTSGRMALAVEALPRHLDDTRSQLEATFRATTVAQFLRGEQFT